MKIHTAPKKKTSSCRGKKSAANSENIPVRCAHSSVVPLDTLKPHPKNPNRHDEAQVELLAKIIRHQGWRAPIVVSKRSDFIVAGHCRLLAAQKLGLKTAPVDFQAFATDEDELAHLAADNRIAELSEIDAEDLAKLIGELDGKLDLELAGFFSKPIEVPAFEAFVASAADVEVVQSLEEVKAARKKANQSIIGKTDTEYYLVVVFRDRQAKQKMLRALQLPDDERYVLAESIRMFPGAGWRPWTGEKQSQMPKAAPMNKSGACG